MNCCMAAGKLILIMLREVGPSTCWKSPFPGARYVPLNKKGKRIINPEELAKEFESFMVKAAGRPAPLRSTREIVDSRWRRWTRR
jgi:hypothetical protein